MGQVFDFPNVTPVVVTPPTTTAATLKQAAANRYQQELAAIEAAAHAAERAQQALDTLDQAKQAAQAAAERRASAVERFGQIAEAHSEKIAALSSEIATWRAGVEQAARAVLDARQQGAIHRQNVLYALSLFAADCAQLTAIPRDELLVMVVDASMAMTAEVSLAPAINANALKNLSTFPGWRAWVGHGDARSETVEKELQKNVSK